MNKHHNSPLRNAATGEYDTNRFSGERGRPASHDTDSTSRLTRRGKVATALVGAAALTGAIIGVEAIANSHGNNSHISVPHDGAHNSGEQARQEQDQQRAKNELDQQIATEVQEGDK